MACLLYQRYKVSTFVNSYFELSIPILEDGPHFFTVMTLRKRYSKPFVFLRYVSAAFTNNTSWFLKSSKQK